MGLCLGWPWGGGCPCPAPGACSRRSVSPGPPAVGAAEPGSPSPGHRDGVVDAVPVAFPQAIRNRPATGHPRHSPDRRMPTPMTDATGIIEAESLRQSLIAYREAAGVWLESVGRLGVSERQIADRLAIGRMILHRLRRFVQADDAISLLEHLPGGRARAEIAETRLPDRLNAVAVADRLITATRDLEAILQRVGPDRDRARPAGTPCRPRVRRGPSQRGPDGRKRRGRRRGLHPSDVLPGAAGGDGTLAAPHAPTGAGITPDVDAAGLQVHAAPRVRHGVAEPRAARRFLAGRGSARTVGRPARVRRSAP